MKRKEVCFSNIPINIFSETWHNHTTTRIWHCLKCSMTSQRDTGRNVRFVELPKIRGWMKKFKTLALHFPVFEWSFCSSETSGKWILGIYNWEISQSGSIVTHLPTVLSENGLSRRKIPTLFLLSLVWVCTLRTLIFLGGLKKSPPLQYFTCITDWSSGGKHCYAQ